MKLNDEAVYACDYRDPPEPASVDEHIDQFDRRKLATRPDLTHVPFLDKGGEEIQYDEEGNAK
jgi:hypothetical protein